MQDRRLPQSRPRRPSPPSQQTHLSAAAQTRIHSFSPAWEETVRDILNRDDGAKAAFASSAQSSNIRTSAIERVQLEGAAEGRIDDLGQWSFPAQSPQYHLTYQGAHPRHSSHPQVSSTSHERPRASVSSSAACHVPSAHSSAEASSTTGINVFPTKCHASQQLQGTILTGVSVTRDTFIYANFFITINCPFTRVLNFSHGPFLFYFCIFDTRAKRFAEVVVLACASDHCCTKQKVQHSGQNRASGGEGTFSQQIWGQGIQGVALVRCAKERRQVM